VWIIFKQFITRIKTGHDQVRISTASPSGNFAHFAPCGFGTSYPTAPQALEGTCLEEQQLTITPDVTVSVQANQCDVEIYPL
jgi:hypothetical protein